MATWNGTTADYNNSANWVFGDTPDAPNEQALFDFTGQALVTVNAPISPGRWWFTDQAFNFTITGAAVTPKEGILNFSHVAESIANDIGGAGSLLQQGSSTLTLTGNNTYTGGTTINSGALRIGNGGATGSIVGDVTNYATLVFSRSNSGQIFDGKISGVGAVVIQNAPFTGFTTFTGNNTYTGGTTIASGTLVIGNNGTTGSVVGNIVNNGLLTFNRADSITFGGLISGSGGMTKFGAGTLTLTANNTYANGTVIAEGTLQLGSGGTTGSIGSSTLNNGGMLTFNHSNTYNFTTSISGTGSVTQLGTGTTVLSGTNTYQGDTFLKAGTLDLAVAGGAGQGSIVFGAGHQTLRIESAALPGTQFSNALTSLGEGDTIDLRGLAFAKGATAHYDASTHALTITSNGVSKTIIINNPEVAVFDTFDDGFGGTQVTPVTGVRWKGTQQVGTHPSGWAPVSTADFNHDGSRDILWFNPATGDVDLWLLRDGHWARSVDIGAHPAGWVPAGVGDFDRDGHLDILWYQGSINRLETWVLTNL